MAKKQVKTAKKKHVGVRVFAVISAVLVATTGALAIFQHFTPYKPIKQAEQTANVDGSGVTDGDGKELESGTVYAMPTSLVYARTTSESAQASEGVTIQATVYPVFAQNKALTWSLSFANPSSSWANGKNVNDYVTVDVNESDSTKATVRCLAPFGEQIILTAQSVANPEVTASCTVDFMQKIESVQMKIGNVTIDTEYYDGVYDVDDRIDLPFPRKDIDIDVGAAPKTNGGAVSVDVSYSEACTISLPKYSISTEFQIPSENNTWAVNWVYGAKSGYPFYFTYNTPSSFSGNTSSESIYFDRSLFDQFNFKIHVDGVTSALTELSGDEIAQYYNVAWNGNPSITGAYFLYIVKISLTYGSETLNYYGYLSWATVSQSTTPVSSLSVSPGSVTF